MNDDFYGEPVYSDNGLKYDNLQYVGISKKGFKKFLKACSKLNRSHPMWKKYLIFDIIFPLLVVPLIRILYLLRMRTIGENGLFVFIFVVGLFIPLLVFSVFYEKLINKFNEEIQEHFDCGFIHFERYTVLEDKADGSFNFDLMFSELSDDQLDFLWFYSRKIVLSRFRKILLTSAFVGFQLLLFGKAILG